MCLYILRRLASHNCWLALPAQFGLRWKNSLGFLAELRWAESVEILVLKFVQNRLVVNRTYATSVSNVAAYAAIWAKDLLLHYLVVRVGAASTIEPGWDALAPSPVLLFQMSEFLLLVGQLTLELLNLIQRAVLRVVMLAWLRISRWVMEVFMVYCTRNRSTWGTSVERVGDFSIESLIAIWRGLDLESFERDKGILIRLSKDLLRELALVNFL